MASRKPAGVPVLTDAQWARLAPLLPKPAPHPKGGRPRVDDRACLERILWVLRTGARWRDLPPGSPSPVTCWRRLGEWEAVGVWTRLWRACLRALDRQGRLDWSECFLDGTFAPAKKGGPPSGRRPRARARS